MAPSYPMEAEASYMGHTESVEISTFHTRLQGEKGTLDYRVHFAHNSTAVSPWHSVPLYRSDGLVHYVCEIPRNTRAKFEVATDEVNNPIKQDSKKGKPRSYGIDMKWNYGMFPQTWEDPSHASEDCAGFVGDNDPVDVVEIGDATASTGGIYAVKPIAALAMIDEGELDWKVIAISEADPRSALVNSLKDVETHFPGVVSEVREWFRTYKTFEGKPENKFELGEQAMDTEYTMNVISQTHNFWKSLVRKSRSNPAAVKVVVGDVPVYGVDLESGIDDAEVSRTIRSILASVKGHEMEILATEEEVLRVAEDEEMENAREVTVLA